MKTDIDSTWKPDECSLDEHRQKILKTLEQPGFGIHAKPKTDQQTVAPELIPDDTDEEHDGGE